MNGRGRSLALWLLSAAAWLGGGGAGRGGRRAPPGHPLASRPPLK
jgi:hypothetical protein